MGIKRIPAWLIAACLVAPALAMAQASAPVSHASAPASRGKVAVSKASTRPLWRELSPGQQQALAPLSAEWDTLNEAQKRKWIALSTNFPKMSAEEQAKLHSRMTEWVTLSPQQRTIARLNYGAAKKLPADEKKAKWEAYQALSPEEKKKLAAKGAKPPPTTAAALHPAPAEKMATVPKQPKPTMQTKAPRIAAAPHQVDPNTLLPQQHPPLPPQAGTPD